MRFSSAPLLAMIGISAWSVVSAENTADTDKTIAHEPKYQSDAPKYCLLIFGQEAKVRVWLVLDGDILYVDRNGNGDLTGAGNKIDKFEESNNEYFPDKLYRTVSLPLLRRNLSVGFSTDKKTGMILISHLEIEPTAAPPRTEAVEGLNQWFDMGLGDIRLGIPLANTPKQAYTMPFDQDLALLVTGVLASEVNKLTRGQKNPISVRIGWRVPDVQGNWVCLHESYSQLFGHNVFPKVEVDIPLDDGSTSRTRASVDYCDCGWRLWATVEIPKNAKLEKAMVNVSFPDWKHGKIKPIVVAIPVAD